MPDVTEPEVAAPEAPAPDRPVAPPSRSPSPEGSQVRSPDGSPDGPPDRRPGRRPAHRRGRRRRPGGPPGSGVPGSGSLPAWLAWATAGVVAVLTSFSLSAVALAMAGGFRPLPTVAGTLAGAGLLLAALWRGGVVRRATGRGVAVWAPAVAAVAVAVAATVWNAAHHGEHLLAERDPGVYVTAARWLADEGDLRPAGLEGPFAEADDLRAHGAGYLPAPDGHLWAQFPALFPAALAAGAWVAGDTGLLAANAVLGGLALLAVYAAGTTLTRPVWSLAATVALAVNLVFVHFVRDAFSEPLTMALLFGGLWAYALARRRPSLAGGAVAGLVLGASCLARVDAFVTLVPLAAVCGLEAVTAAADRAGRRWRRRAFAVAVAVPAGAVAALAALEVDRFSPAYAASLSGEYLLAAEVAAVVAAAGAVLAVLAVPLLAAARRSAIVADVGRALLVALAAFVAAGLGAWLWALHAVRPDGLDLTRRLPPREERGPYSVLGMRWLDWYLGRPALVAASLAWCLLVFAVAVSRRHRGAAAFVAVLSATSLLYLFRPLIAPDQIWAMRRFLPVTMPGLYLAAAWLAGELWRRWGRWWSVAPRAVAVGIAAAAVAGSVVTVAPVPGERTNAGALGAVAAVCEEVGPDGAVLIVPGNLVDLALPQTLRFFCGVPTATFAGDLDDAALADLAGAWAADGRDLHVLATGPEPALAVDPADGVRVASVRLEALEYTALRRPERMEVDVRVVKPADGSLELYVFPVAAPTSSR